MNKRERKIIEKFNKDNFKYFSVNENAIFSLNKNNDFIYSTEDFEMIFSVDKNGNFIHDGADFKKYIRGFIHKHDAMSKNLGAKTIPLLGPDIPKMENAQASTSNAVTISRVTNAAASSVPSEINSGSDYKNIPKEGGRWAGEPGNSMWIPSYALKPKPKSKNTKYNNPDDKTWEDILKQYGAKGVIFKNGYIDFEETQKQCNPEADKKLIRGGGGIDITAVEVIGERMSTDRSDNFDRADKAIAARRKCTPEEVEAWRKKERHVWHECEDGKTMQKIPHDVHANIPHRGGVSQIRAEEKAQGLSKGKG